MRLRTQVINLIRLNLLEDVPQPVPSDKIARMKEHPRIGLVRIHIQMVNPICIERRTPAEDPVNLIPLFKEKLRQIGAVLSRNTRNQCLFHFHIFHGAFPFSHSASR